MLPSREKAPLCNLVIATLLFTCLASSTLAISSKMMLKSKTELSALSKECAAAIEKNEKEIGKSLSGSAFIDESYSV